MFLFIVCGGIIARLSTWKTEENMTGIDAYATHV